jgi:hypothetical protein
MSKKRAKVANKTKLQFTKGFDFVGKTVDITGTVKGDVEINSEHGSVILPLEEFLAFDDVIQQLKKEGFTA